jgi:hypothetical protein
MKTKILPFLLLVLSLSAISFSPRPAADLSQEFNFTNYSELSFSSSFNVTITRGDRYSMVISGPEDLFEGLEVTQDGKLVEVGYEKKRKSFGTSTLKIRITMPDLEVLSVSGSVKAEINEFKGESLQMDLSGASNCELNSDFKNVKIDVSGAGNLKLVGTGDLMVLNLSGASNFDASSFRCKKVNLNMSGAGAASVFASEQLDVEVSGVGSVKYAGNPVVLNKRLSGMASIKPIDED